jgi:molybdopterin synthase sulfur carrier subunit
VTIRVRFFATLREQVGRGDVTIDQDVPDVSALWRHLEQMLPANAIAALRASGVRIAVNQEMIEHNAALAPGDEVAFLPPITGG